MPRAVRQNRRWVPAVGVLFEPRADFDPARETIRLGDLGGKIEVEVRY